MACDDRIVSMSWDLFEKFILEIKSRSDELMDHWTYHKINDREGGAYISKKIYGEDDSEEVLEGFEEDLSLENSLEAERENESSIVFEFHIVYNIAFSCPMLYFNASKNGLLLTMEEYWQLADLSNDANKYEMLTQLEHPLLRLPFLALHPCKTENLLLRSSKNPVVSWLSAVGPVVGLNMSVEYAKLTFDQ